MVNRNETAQGLNYGALWSQIEREATRKFVHYVSRREFIKLLGTGAAGAALVGMRGQSAAAQVSRVERARARAEKLAQATSARLGTLPNGVASGDTSQTGTVLWTRSTTPGTVKFEVATDEAFNAVIAEAEAEMTDAALPVKVQIDALTPDTRYFYRVTDAGGTTLTGTFRTAAETGARVGLRFGVSGDWRGELRPYVGLRNAVERDLAFFVALGDTIYADIPSLDFTDEQAVALDEFRVKHLEVYSDRHGLNTWADVRAATSILATIDDHEVTNDFAGGAAPASDERFAGFAGEFINQTELYVNGLRAFGEYNPLRDEVYSGTDDPRMEGRPKLYRYQTYGSDAAVIVLDARSFRDESQPEPEPTAIFNAAARAEFRASLFEPGRTMLGRTQVEDLKRDLLAAQTAGITWKFVMIPEPAQNTGWFGGNDRWEGYAPERTEVLQFINDNGIANVVFVAADVHTTFINKLVYEVEPGGEQTPVAAFEISTGSVAFFPPTGAALVDGAAQFNLVPAERYTEYQAMSLAEKDAVLLDLFTRYVTQLEGYPDLGLDDAGLDVSAFEGLPIVGHSFGWTEFDIEAETGALTVTTYGVAAYDAETVANSPDAVNTLTPEVLCRFTVLPRT
jgi:phosphodiesterase/alkaline phosphatase D-like protein